VCVRAQVNLALCFVSSASVFAFMSVCVFVRMCLFLCTGPPIGVTIHVTHLYC